MKIHKYGSKFGTFYALSNETTKPIKASAVTDVVWQGWANPGSNNITELGRMEFSKEEKESEEKGKEASLSLADHIRRLAKAVSEGNGGFFHVLSDGTNAVAIVTPSRTLTTQMIPAQIKSTDLKGAKRAPVAVVSQMSRILKTDIEKFLKGTKIGDLAIFVATKGEAVPLLKPRQMKKVVEAKPLAGQLETQVERVEVKPGDEGV